MGRRTKDETSKPDAVIVGSTTALPIREPDASGRWYWLARRRVDGKRETVWTGRAHRDEVERYVIGALGEKERESARPRSACESWTVDDLLDYWHGDQVDREGVDLKPKTVEAQRNAWRRLSKYVGLIKVARLESWDVERMVRARIRAGDAPGTVNYDVGTLRTALRWGYKRGYTPRIELDVKVKVPKELHHTPTRFEVLAVYEALGRPVETRRGHKVTPPPWMRQAFYLYWATGCRTAELSDLRRRQLHLSDDAPYLEVRGKTGYRAIPLAEAVLEELSTWDLPADPDARVWPVAPNTVRVDLRIRLAAACREAGVAPFSIQALRRHATDALYGTGSDPGVESAIVGHSPEVAMRAYRQARRVELRSAMERAGLGVVPAAEGEVLAFPAGGRRR